MPGYSEDERTTLQFANAMEGRFGGFFDRAIASLVAYPGFVLPLLLVLLIGGGITKVHKDPSVDAFVPLAHPAALARDEAMAVFGLEDPIVVALASTDGTSMLTAQRLALLDRIQQRIAQVPGVKHHDLISLLTEQIVFGANGTLDVEPIVDISALTGITEQDILQRLHTMPMLVNLLASSDGQLLTMIVPVDDPNDAGDIYAALLTLLKEEVPPELQAHVAGVAAMNAALSYMVDFDTRIFVPLAVVAVLLILLLAFRDWAAVAGPLFVIAGSAAIAVGMMGWLGAHYYLITTALPVIVMAMAVADCLHFSQFYFRARLEEPRSTHLQSVRRAMRLTGLPISLTSLTTAGGFLGLWVGSDIRPISEFGLFAAIGVTAAWFLSLTALPSLLLLMRLEPAESRRRWGDFRGFSGKGVDEAVMRLSEIAYQHPLRSMLMLLMCLGALAALASFAGFDYQRSKYFQPDNPVRVADQRINEQIAGLNFLDVLVTADEEGALLLPENIRLIDDLEESLRQIGGISKVTGLADYMRVMHTALHENPEAPLPAKAHAPAQYMLLYEASGAPEDYRQEIDYSYTKALIRTQLKTDSYAATQPIVKRVKQVVALATKDRNVTAVVSGRVAVNAGWMSALERSHFVGLALALGIVSLCLILSLRSFTSAALAMLPVAFGVLFVYAIMGVANIDIAPATAMTSAIATGLGADFGVHLISHLRNGKHSAAHSGQPFDERYLLIGRACFYSALSLGIALMVICLSSAPPLRWFGLLIAAGTFGSLFGALVVIPAALGLIAQPNSAHHTTLESR